jgi:hypothetical protein
MVESPVTTPIKTAEASPYAWQGGLGPMHEQALVSVPIEGRNKSDKKRQKVYFLISFSS